MLTETIKGISYMNNYAIGVFDSGMGGLTAVKELNALMPTRTSYISETPQGSHTAAEAVKLC